MSSAGVRLVLSPGRPDPDALSTATLWSLIAHLGLIAAALVVQALPSASTPGGPSHFVTLAGPPPGGGGGGGRPEPDPPKPRAEPPAPKEPAPEPPVPTPKAPTKASVPSDKPAKPAPPAPEPTHAPAPGPQDETPGKRCGAGKGDPGASGGAVGPPGGGGGVGGTSIGEGDFRYAWYVTAIEAKLQSAWRRPMATVTEPQTVVVSFTILTGGAVKDVAVATESGNASLDLSAIRAVYDANPLPALPRGWTKDSVHVSMQFVLTPSEP